MLTKDEAIKRIAEIDAEFDKAARWGSWMSMASNEREDLANWYGLEHRWQIRCGGERTN